MSDDKRKKLALLGTKEFPIRISSVPQLMRCPRAAVIKMLRLLPDESGQAAQNGTASAAAIEAWHHMGEIAKALEAAFAKVGKENPLADWGVVTNVLTAYAGDARNAPLERIPSEPLWGKVHNDGIEIDCAFEHHDVWYKGRADCLREVDKVLRLWDWKLSGMFTGNKIVNENAFQIAGYVLAITEMMQAEVQPGGIIRLTDYTLKTRGSVFYPAKWTYDHCVQMYDRVSATVRAMRLVPTEVALIPGHYCDYCAGGPDLCIPLWTDAFYGG